MSAHATNGRGHFMLAVMCWRWQDAGALQHLHTTGPRPDWIATVPAPLDRPAWIPATAQSRVMDGDDTCYWWGDDA